MDCVSVYQYHNDVYILYHYQYHNDCVCVHFLPVVY